MSKDRRGLIAVLRLTAARLSSGARYSWTHQGVCNCGHLAQTVTGLDGPAIHEAATRSEGDWADHAREFCATTGKPVDSIIGQMLALGLSLEEIASLERLSDRRVLRYLPDGRRHLDHRRRDDVVLYLRTWADVLDADRRSKDGPVVLNGKAFEPERRDVIPLALDEHPDAGAA